MDGKEAQHSSPFVRVVGTVLALALVGGAVWLFWLWYDASRNSGVPAVMTPRPWVYQERQQVQGLLLYKERVLRSPQGGTLQLRAGGAAQSVAKGETVASLVSLSGRVGLKSPDKGVFLPWVDGKEATWTYANFWPGTALFPEEPAKYYLKDGVQLGDDLVIGKLVPTPQTPRVLVYANLTDSLKSALDSGKVEIKFEPEGQSWHADVRVWLDVGAGKAKIALDLPLFPLWLMEHRKINFYLCSGSESGVLVPDSAVVLREGKWGVYELLGNEIVWRAVDGTPEREGQFFVRSGLDLANPVVIDGANARERRVDLW